MKGASILYRSRFLFLLVCLLALGVLSPMLEPLFRLRMVIDTLLTAVLISGIYTFRRNRRQTIVAAVLASALIAALWVGHALEMATLEVAANVLGIMFTGLLTYAILHFLFTQRHVTSEVISAAVVGYLLLGLLFAFLYAVVETVIPGSFPLPDTGSRELRSLLYYFSFVTLTTLGYGDIVPLSDAARSFTFLEAVLGQLYLTVLVARLVGLHISQTLSPPKE